MMFQEITSKNVEITSLLFPAESASIQLKEIGIGKLEDLHLRFLGEPLFAFNLSEIIKIETLTSRYQPYEFKTETVFAEGLYKRVRQVQCLIKISKMIDKILDEDDEGLFEGILKHKLLKTLSEKLMNISFDWDKITDDEIFKRIKQILALEVMSGLLKDLTPEELKIFDEAAKRRPLFK